MNPATNMVVPPPMTSAPSAPSSGLGAGFAVLGPISAVAVCTPLAILALVAPKFAEIFRDFGVALPGISVLQIRVGVALASPVGICVLLLLALLIVLVVGFASHVNRAIGLVLLGLCGVWFLASIGIVVVGLMLPLVAMIESLQQSGTA